MTPERRPRLVDGPIVREWMEHAACLGVNPELFYPGHGAVNVEREAKRICGGCPVRGQCLEHALRTEEPYGIWGGLSEIERREIRRSVA